MSADLETALYLAMRGFFIAPLLPNSKKPSGHWRQQSTTDFDTIKGWFIDPYMGWSQELNILIDTAKSGLCVVDLDNKQGKDGSGQWFRLQEENGVVGPTFTVATPTGGFHLFFRATGYTNTTGKLAQGIDTRAEGGYVVAPSSTLKGFLQPDGDYTETDACGNNIYVDGTYLVTQNNGHVIDLPDWIGEKLSAHKVSTLIAQRGRIISEDDAGDIAWATDFLQRHEPAIEGCGGDNHTYKMFCALKEHGISEEKALELAWDHWNERCLPPWKFDDLAQKAENAYKSAQNATGVKSPLAEFTIPELPVHNLPFELLKPVQRFNVSDIPFRPWVFGNMMLRRNLTLIGSSPGTGKSTLVLLLALSKATGRNLIGVDPKGRGRVAVYNNEDEMEEMNRRLAALMQVYDITWDDLWDPDVMGKNAKPYLYISSGQDNPFKIAERAAKGGQLSVYIIAATLCVIFTLGSICFDSRVKQTIIITQLDALFNLLNKK